MFIYLASNQVRFWPIKTFSCQKIIWSEITFNESQTNSGMAIYISISLYYIIDNIKDAVMTIIQALGNPTGQLILRLVQSHQLWNWREVTNHRNHCDVIKVAPEADKWVQEIFRKSTIAIVTSSWESRK